MLLFLIFTVIMILILDADRRPDRSPDFSQGS